MPKMYRQGDLLFIEVEKFRPKRGFHRVKDNVILMGEATGHSHRLEHGELYEDFSTRSMCIIAEEDATVVHEEHAPLKLERGYYKVVIQREYDPLTGVKTKYVVD